MERKSLIDKALEKAAGRGGKPFRKLLIGITAFATAYALINPAATLDTEGAEDTGLLPEKTEEVTTQEPAADNPAEVTEEQPQENVTQEVVQETQETQEPAEPAQTEQEEAAEPAEAPEETAEEAPEASRTEYTYT